MATDAPGPGWVVDALLARSRLLAETRRPSAWSVIVGLRGGTKLFQAADLPDQRTAEALALAQMDALAAAEDTAGEAGGDHA